MTNCDGCGRRFGDIAFSVQPTQLNFCNKKCLRKYILKNPELQSHKHQWNKICDFCGMVKKGGKVD